MVIAIDGPAGSGKGTVARLLAKKLGFTHLDSGSFYRVVAFYVISNQVDPADRAKIVSWLPQLQVELRQSPRGGKIYSRGRDLTDEIRYDLVSQCVSRVSCIPEVRAWVNRTVRQLATGRSVVVEGRDMTTEVFPRAELKFYLDAEIDERARRRYLELKNKGDDVTLSKIQAGLAERDQLDSRKPRGALRVAPDAIYVDSTKMSPSEVVNFMAKKFNSLSAGAKTS